MPKKTIKSGVHTSEFWVSSIAMCVILVLLATGKITAEDVSKLWPLLISGGAYAVSRGVAKLDLNSSE